jgi:hypothetical protein
VKEEGSGQSRSRAKGSSGSDRTAAHRPRAVGGISGAVFGHTYFTDEMVSDIQSICLSLCFYLYLYIYLSISVSLSLSFSLSVSSAYSILLPVLLPVPPPLLQDALLLEGVGKFGLDWVRVAAYVSKSGGCFVDRLQCGHRYSKHVDPALQKLNNGLWTESEVT